MFRVSNFIGDVVESSKLPKFYEWNLSQQSMTVVYCMNEKQPARSSGL